MVTRLILLAGAATLATPALADSPQLFARVDLADNYTAESKVKAPLIFSRALGNSFGLSVVSYGRAALYADYGVANDGTISYALASWRDQFTISVEQPTTVFFFIDVRPRLTDLVGATAATSLFTETRIFLNSPEEKFGVNQWGLGKYQTVTDTGEIKTTEVVNGNNGTTIQTAGGAPASYTRYLIGRTFTGTNTYELQGDTRCTMYDFSDQPAAGGTSGTCAAELRWGGFAYAFAATGAPAEVAFGLGASGTDWSQPFGSAIAVPEPATWAMLIGGFGLVGLTARRRRRRLVPA